MPELVPGTLEMLILRTLLAGPMHGYGIAQRIHEASDDVLYVEELIGPETVNTMPLATLDAFRDHGRVRGDTVTFGLTEASQSLEALARLGIDLNAIAERLQIDGISAFASDYDRVLAAIERKRPSVASAGSSGEVS